jgi:transposase
MLFGQDPGGRDIGQRRLHLVLPAADRRNPVIRAFSGRLVTAGQPKNVARIACLRKRLTILNAMMRTNTTWLQSAEVPA